MKRLLAILLTIALAGCASLDDRKQAYASGVADCLTTAAGLAVGLAEMNPAGPVVACAIKPVAVEIAASQDEPERTQALHAIEAAWYGAATNNAVLIVGKLVAGASLKAVTVIAPVAGIIVAVHLWQSGEQEREFMRQCAIHRQDDPALACVYRP